MKIAIIGGGIVGATMAHLFGKAGASLHLFEAGEFGSGATNVGFAWINGSTEIPEYYRLKVDSNNRWRTLQDEFAARQFLFLDGHIEWSTNANEVMDAYGSDGQRLEGPPLSPQERLRQKVSWLSAAGFGARMLSRDEIQSAEPDLNLPDSVTEAGFYPREGWLSPHLAIGSLLESARLHGAVVRSKNPVASIITNHGRATGIRMVNGQTMEADYVVVAAGAWSAEVLATVGAKLPLAGTDGMTAITTPVTTTLRSVVHTDELSVRPDGGGRLMIRHHSFDRVVKPGDTLTDAEAATAELLRRTSELIPAAASARVAEIRVGHRPIPADGLPVIGDVPGVEGVYVAVAHGAVTLAPALAEIALEEVVHQRKDPRAEIFRPQRFA